MVEGEGESVGRESEQIEREVEKVWRIERVKRGEEGG